PVEAGPAAAGLGCVAHHLVFDGQSKDVLVADLAAAYNARLAGGAPDLPPAPPPYADHVAGERQRVAEALPAARRYWAARGRPGPAVLPGLTGSWSAAAGDPVRWVPDEALDRRIRAAAAGRGLSTFAFLTAALTA